ncbi:TnsD family Tn7-like transposition protein [Sphingomonas antarctica]|uniref:TnsD family Tn7-like transposition protein n=1 Tax=Sphingomonas antarctica TaxID=2040274 RepID=UPI0039EA85CA
MFPAPIAGELLYGVLARHGFLAGSPNAAEHATELFGRRSAVATFDLPSGLDALASNLPALSGLDGAGLLRHTLFPFYAAFQDEEARSAAEFDMRASDASSAHHRLGVAAFRIRAGVALRFCPECVVAQRATHGFATWMVAHQLPGFPVCPEHGCWLRDSMVTRSSAGRHGYVAPDERNCPVDGASSLDVEVPDLLLDLARAANAITTGAMPARPLSHWRDHYVTRLAGVALMRSARKVDQSGLNESLAAYWAPVFPHLPAACAFFGERGWAAAMVRSHRKAMHPLLHLLMDGFLSHLERGGTVVAGSEFVSVGGMSLPHSTSAVNPRTGRTPRADWPALDAALAREVEREATIVGALIPPVRATPAEIERRVRRSGWFGKRRSKRPLATTALAAIEEPLDAFRRRRAAHWAATLGPGCRPWQVMRPAGLRSDQLPMIREVMAQAAASAAR